MLCFQNCSNVAFSNLKAVGLVDTPEGSQNFDVDPDDDEGPDVEPDPEPEPSSKTALCGVALKPISDPSVRRPDDIENFAYYNEDHSAIYLNHIFNGTLNNVFGILGFSNVDRLQVHSFMGTLRAHVEVLESMTNTDAAVTMSAYEMIDISNSGGSFCLNAVKIGAINDFEGDLLIENAEVEVINGFKGKLTLVNSKVKLISRRTGTIELIDSAVVNETP